MIAHNALVLMPGEPAEVQLRQPLERDVAAARREARRIERIEEIDERHERMREHQVDAAHGPHEHER